MPSCRSCMIAAACGPLTEGMVSITIALVGTAALELAAEVDRASLLMLAWALFAWLVCGPPQAPTIRKLARAKGTVRISSPVIADLFLRHFPAVVDHFDDS